MGYGGCCRRVPTPTRRPSSEKRGQRTHPLAYAEIPHFPRASARSRIFPRQNDSTPSSPTALPAPGEHTARATRGDGGPDRDQTDDLVVANDALYQLSYWPPREVEVLRKERLQVNTNFCVRQFQGKSCFAGATCRFAAPLVRAISAAQVCPAHGADAGFRRFQRGESVSPT